MFSNLLKTWPGRKNRSWHWRSSVHASAPNQEKGWLCPLRGQGKAMLKSFSCSFWYLAFPQKLLEAPGRRGFAFRKAFSFSLYFWKWKTRAKCLHGICKKPPEPIRRELPVSPFPSLRMLSSSSEGFCLHGLASRCTWQRTHNQCWY